MLHCADPDRLQCPDQRRGILGALSDSQILGGLQKAEKVVLFHLAHSYKLSALPKVLWFIFQPHRLFDRHSRPPSPWWFQYDFASA